MSVETVPVEVALNLEQVTHEFETWRSSRQHKGRIPERLWQAALSLVKSYPPSQVSQQLHLNYSEVKRRMDDYEAPSRGSHISFIEVGLPEGDRGPDRSPTRCLFEVETSAGTRYRCTMTGPVPEG